jgi:hypothetical protein
MHKLHQKKLHESAYNDRSQPIPTQNGINDRSLLYNGVNRVWTIGNVSSPYVHATTGVPSPFFRPKGHNATSNMDPSYWVSLKNRMAKSRRTRWKLVQKQWIFWSSFLRNSNGFLEGYQHLTGSASNSFAFNSLTERTERTWALEISTPSYLILGSEMIDEYALTILSFYTFL